MRRKICLVVLVLLLIPSSIQTAVRTHPIPSPQFEALVLGVFLNGLLDRVEQAIARFEQAGRGIAIEAGVQANIAISNAKIAYEEMLGKTIRELNSSVTRTLHQLQSMVNDLEQKADAQIQEVTTSAQLIVNSLPFSRTMPQLRAVSPRFIVPAQQSYPVQLRFRGNFVDAVRQGFKPVLRVEGVSQSFDAAEVSTSELRFLVPVSAIRPHGPNSSFSYTRVQLSVPFKQGLLGRRKEGEFALLIGVLPASPGKIVLHHKEVIKNTEKQHHKTGVWAQHSSNDDHKDVKYCGPDHPGWRIVPESVQFQIERRKVRLFNREFEAPVVQGTENDEWSKRLISTNPTVCYSVTTIYHRFGTSGKVNFYFEYDIVREVTSDVWKQETVQLRWGDSKLFPYPPGFWKVYFDAFDGRHVEFQSPIDNHPFLKAIVEGDSVRLTATRPELVNWP